MSKFNEMIHTLKSKYYILRESIADNRGNIHGSIGYRLAYVRQQIRYQTNLHNMHK